MAAFEPFQAHVVASVAGKTINFQVTTTSQSNTIDSTGGETPTLLVTCNGPVGIPAYIRMDAEAAPTATATDTPMNPGSVRLFANPVAAGKVGIAVFVTVTGASITNIWVTPGQGGI